MGILDRIKEAFTAQQSYPVETPHSEPNNQELPPTFYIDTIESDRVEKDRFFQTSPYSPIADRTHFTGLSYYPPNPAFRYILPLKRA
jgi:uncharacterized protein (DUF1684 family)